MQQTSVGAFVPSFCKMLTNAGKTCFMGQSLKSKKQAFSLAHKSKLLPAERKSRQTTKFGAAYMQLTVYHEQYAAI